MGLKASGRIHNADFGPALEGSACSAMGHSSGIAALGPRDDFDSEPLCPDTQLLYGSRPKGIGCSQDNALAI
jgi:hypothetical protein